MRTQALGALGSVLLLLAATVAHAEPAATGTPAGVPPQLENERGSLSEMPPAAEPPAPARVAAPAPAPLVPALHHAPVSSAKEGEPLTLHAAIERPNLVRSASVVYRAGDKWFTVKLLRTEEEYAATIPAEHVKPPFIGYAIEMEQSDGSKRAVFASRDELQPVIVREDGSDVRERWLLDRLGGRRSVVSATAELVRFGSLIGPSIPCAAGQTTCKAGDAVTPQVDDQYWRADASYTYRPLRAVYEFGFRAGVVRGTRYTTLEEYSAKKYEVGLNYAGANVRFRLASIFHADLEALGSVTEVGFSVGAGAAVIFGDPLGIKLTAGWQTIGFTNETYFGTRFYTRLDLPVGERVTLVPSIEVTDMPHADEFGVRLLADAGLYVGRGFTLWLRGGYQARLSRSGGPALGATVQYGF